MIENNVFLGPMWTNLRKDIDLEDPTFLLNQVCWGFTQREAEVDHETVQSKADLYRRITTAEVTNG